MSWFQRFLVKKDRPTPQNIPKEKSKASINADIQFLMTTSDAVELTVIESKLRAYEIPVFKKFREAGDYLNIFMGSSVFGADLYVPADRLEQAKDMLTTDELAEELKTGEDKALEDY